MTRNTDAAPDGRRVRNEGDPKRRSRNDWRASLVPAAAVIPAPIAYVKVVAVKKLVVDRREPQDSDAPSGTDPGRGPGSSPRAPRRGRVAGR